MQCVGGRRRGGGMLRRGLGGVVVDSGVVVTKFHSLDGLTKLWVIVNNESKSCN